MEKSYSSAEMQSVYSATPDDWARQLYDLKISYIIVYGPQTVIIQIDRFFSLNFNKRYKIKSVVEKYSYLIDQVTWNDMVGSDI